MTLLSAERSALLVIDTQQRLMPAVADAESVLARIGLLLQAAVRLGVPVLATEHYPAGIGRTVPEVRERLPEGAVVEKIHFSAAAEPAFAARAAALGRDQFVFVGAETHVCVLQTALDFAARGASCFVVADATASRRRRDAEQALERLRGRGVGVVTSEMVVFEWLGRGGTDAFRDLLPRIR